MFPADHSPRSKLFFVSKVLSKFVQKFSETKHAFPPVFQWGVPYLGARPRLVSFTPCHLLFSDCVIPKDTPHLVGLRRILCAVNVRRKVLVYADAIIFWIVYGKGYAVTFWLFLAYSVNVDFLTPHLLFAFVKRFETDCRRSSVT